MIPGLNTVPVKYLDELREYEIATETRTGKPGKLRRPGVELLEELQKPVVQHTLDGTIRAPQITIHEEPLADREDGPPAPFSLDGYQEKAAMALIKVTSSGKTLQQWAENTKDKKIKSAVQTKLAAGVTS